jgi:hypothetical protein
MHAVALNGFFLNILHLNCMAVSIQCGCIRRAPTSQVRAGLGSEIEQGTKNEEKETGWKPVPPFAPFDPDALSPFTDVNFAVISCRWRPSALTISKKVLSRQRAFRD